MIFFRELNILDKNDKQKFKEWKRNIELCDLIMSDPVNLNSDQLEYWIIKNSNDSNQYFKSVHRASDNNLIGLARLMFIDNVSRIAEVGLYIGNVEDRNGNYGSLILKHLIEVAFDEYRLNKIFARISDSNKGSINLFKKFQFTMEGKLRDHHYSCLHNRFNDVLILSKFNIQ